MTHGSWVQGTRWRMTLSQAQHLERASCPGQKLTQQLTQPAMSQQRSRQGLWGA